MSAATDSFAAFCIELDAFCARYGDRVSLKSIKHFAAGSEETDCFVATLYLDGKKAGDVRNDGHGGCNSYGDWGAVRAFSDEVNAAEVAAGRGRMPEGLDTLVSHAFAAHLERKDAQKWRRQGKIAFRLAGGEAGVWQLVTWPQAAKTWPAMRPAFIDQALRDGWFKDHRGVTADLDGVIYANDLLVSP